MSIRYMPGDSGSATSLLSSRVDRLDFYWAIADIIDWWQHNAWNNFGKSCPIFQKISKQTGIFFENIRKNWKNLR